MSKAKQQPTLHRITCTVCDFRATTDRSKTHAFALGRRHYHGEGHPVTYHEEPADE